MSRAQASVSVSDLSRDLAGVLRSVRESREPLVVTEQGKAAAFLLSVETYERAERERELLLLLAKGEKEIAAREGHDLDDVLAAIDDLLERGDA